MKTGIMGGTFNPVHIAHIIIAQYALEQHNLDRIIFMPGGNPPHKQNSSIESPKNRFEMVKLAIDGFDKFYISDYEVKKNEYSYTVDTLKHLHKKMPQDEIYFIVGEDSLADIYKWYMPEQILSMCTLLVYPRNNNKTLNTLIDDVANKMGGKILPIDAPMIDLSSTMIRKRFAAHKSVRYMLPENVINFIETNNLYKR